MIAALFALLLQPDPAGALLGAQAVSDGFQSLCVRHLDDMDALRAAIRRSPLGFARVRDTGSWERYQAASATVRLLPGTGCAFEARLASRGEGIRVIDDAYAALGMETPPGAVNRPGTAARYMSRGRGEAGRTGLSASLDWGRLGAPDETPVTLSLWVFRRTTP